MAKHPSRDPAVRAAVVAALLAGQSVSQAAKQYKLPKGTVSNWKTRCAQKVSGVRAKDGTQKEAVGALLMDLVQENLRGLIAGARLLQDEKWLRTQDAAEIGTLLGITHDKTVRMLEALGGASNRAS